MIRTRQLSLRTSLVASIFALLLAGCPSGGDLGSDTDDGGGAGTDGAGPGPLGPDGGSGTGDGSTTTPKDGAAPDAADAAPACGRLTTLCTEGETCAGAPDCASKVCTGGACKAAAPADGVQNGDETDVDCGGTKAPACIDGKKCVAKTDCSSGVCTGKICQAPTSTDGVQNGDETDVDCGGTTTNAPKCASGQGCASTADCNNLKCDTVAKKCLPAAHDDGLQNLDETGVDCGGPTAPNRCAPGGGCAATTDCANVLCNAGTHTCDPPSSGDGLKNGSETDTDCGGGLPTNAPGCVVGQTCGVDGDCGSSACNYAGKCVESVSCKVQHGGDTCGPNGTSSCCASLPIAPGDVKLDKYNITAGRMRAFVDFTGGNMRGWINAHTPAWWNASWTAFLPNVLDNGLKSPDDSPAFSGVYEELGPYVHGTAGGANEGCYITGSGARTFRLPDEVNAAKRPDGSAGMNDPQLYAQAFLDERPINCVTVYMLAAFCAWDGGRLPTHQQVDVAWGAGTYPWGSQAPAGYDKAYGIDPNGKFGKESYGGFQTGPFVSAPFPLTDIQYANYNYNWWGGDSQKGLDYSIYLAPPGRFPKGDSATGHSDLAGSVFNATDINGTNVFWSRSGSWQGHNIPWTGKGSWLNAPATNKYWAMGGRCVRP